MSRSFPAKYASNCAGCGGKITKGSPIRMNDGDAFHDGCAPTGNPRADAEYLKGAREANRYMEDRALFGEDYAAREEYNHMMRDPDGW